MVMDAGPTPGGKPEDPVQTPGREEQSNGGIR